LFIPEAEVQVSAATIIVDDDGTPGVDCNYTSIQDAINNSIAGDTIRVYAGTYHEKVVVNKTVTLIGNGSANTVIDGSGIDDVIHITANWVNMSDLQVKDGSMGIHISSDNVSISNTNINLIRGENGLSGGNGEDGYTGVGIYLDSSHGTNISNNFIYNIRGGNGGDSSGWFRNGGIGGTGVGILLQTSTNCIIMNNSINTIYGGNGGIGGPGGGGGPEDGYGGPGGFGIGMIVHTSMNNIIVNNSINKIYGGNGNYGGGPAGGPGGVSAGIYLQSSSDNTFTINTIYTINGGIAGPGGWGAYGGDSAGIYLETSTSNNINNNTLHTINGGPGGTGGMNRTGGDGGIGAGLYLQSSQNNNIKNNSMHTINGGNGGTGGGTGSGGVGGVGTGIYLQSSINNNIMNNTISTVNGGSGGSGGPGGINGASQVGFGIFIDSDSLNNIVEPTNTMDGDAILFYYNQNGITIENYSLNANSNPTNFGEIALINCFNFTIRNNNIENFTGISGGFGVGSGGPGGVGVGIYLQSSPNNNIENNTINKINGGAVEYGSLDGVGIYLQSSPNNIIKNNTISEINVGTGGPSQNGFGIFIDDNSLNNTIEPTNTMDGDAILYYYNQNGIPIENYSLTADSNPTNFGKIAIINCNYFTIKNNEIANFTGATGNPGPYGETGDTGGVGAGIYLQISNYNDIINNTISSINGGKGGDGGYKGSGAVGGFSAGIYLHSSTNNNIMKNIIKSINGSNGGTKGKHGADGASQVGVGIFIDDKSLNNTIQSTNTMDGDEILYYYNQDGVIIENYSLKANSNPTNYGKITIINCSDFIIKNNEIANFTGISGETGVRSWNPWDDPNGRVGGVGAGICFLTSKNTTIVDNIISTINGGTGGSGGYYGNGGVGGIGAGIYFQSSTNSTIKNNTMGTITGGVEGPNGCLGWGGVGGVGAGIYLLTSTNNTLKDNDVNTYTGGSGNSDSVGICLQTSSNNTFMNNTITISGTEYEYGFYFKDVQAYDNDINISNKVNGIPLRWYTHETGISINDVNVELNRINNIAQIMLYDCNNVNLTNSTFHNGYGFGIYLYLSSNNKLMNNSCSNNSEGIYLEPSTGNIIINNTCNSNTNHGIYLYSSSGNIIENNTCNSNNQDGIYLESSSDNRIYYNNFSNNNNGIFLDTSSDNNILENNICNSDNNYGIFVEGSTNTIINNTCSNNDYGIFVEGSSNTIVNNNCSDNDYGIFIEGTSNSIVNNSCQNNIRGIEISGVINTIFNNTCLNNNDGIWVEGSNNTLENNTCSNNNYGIFIEGSSNTVVDNKCWNNINGIEVRGTINSILNNTCLNNSRGINVGGSNHLILSNNCSNNQFHGIQLDGTLSNTIKNNTMFSCGIFIVGHPLRYWNTHVIDDNNTVNGKPVYFWKNVTTGKVPQGAGQVILANCTNVIVDNQNVNNGSAGIVAGFSSNITIANNTASNNNMYGIYQYFNDNVIIENNNCSNNDNDGIYLYNSEKNRIINNTCSNNDQNAIYLRYSHLNMINSNAFNSNTDYGIYLDGSHNNVISNNNGESNSDHNIYLYHSYYNRIENNSGNLGSQTGIYLRHSDGNIIRNNTYDSNTNNGIHLYSSSENTIDNNICNSNTINGIYLYYSNLNTLTNNTYESNNESGIQLVSSPDNNIIGNNVTNNIDGIHLTSSSYNNIIGNNVTNNIDGIHLTSSSYNNITINNISNNENGIFLTSSSDNLIFHNRFIDNIIQSFDDTNYGNQWDNGYPSGGNYWSDYGGVDNLCGPNQDQTGRDGIGDTEYSIDSDSKDNYPLMGFIVDIDPRIYLISPSNNSVNLPGVTLDFHIYDEDLDFVNYSIDGGITQTFTEPFDISTTGWTDGSHIVQINAMDFIGNSSSRWYLFIIDSKEPVIILNSPVNNSLIPSGTFLNFSIIEPNIDVVYYSVNGGAADILNNPYDISTSGWSDGDYTIEIFAFDLVGFWNSSWYNFTVDFGDPFILLNAPLNNSVIPNGTILDFSIIDITFTEANYSINGGANISFFDPFDISTSGWTDGDYIVQINALDSLGNSNSSWFLFTIDSTVPTFILNAPLNNSIIIGGTVLDFLVNDLHLDIVTYSINGGVDTPLNSPFNISTSGWSDGDYTVQINAVDIAGNSNSSWYFFTLDSTPPTISLNVPENNSVIPSGTILDFSVIDTHLLNINISINGGADVPFLDPYDNSTAGWSDGDYTVQINAVDIAGNAKSSWYFFTIDSTPPIIILNDPGNNSVIPSGTILDFLVTDLHLDHVNYSINNGGDTPLIDPFDINTSGWLDGDYTVQINIVDIAGNSNSSWYFFTIDSTPPTIILNEPWNNSVIPSGTLLDFSVTDTHLSAVNYSINGGADIPLPDPYDNSTTGWPDGDYTIQINALDLAGNSNSRWYFFTIDSTLPTIILNEPGNNSIIPSGTILDFSVVDSNLLHVNISINGGAEVPFLDPFDNSTEGWLDGDYIVQINAVDMAGNSNSSWYFFTIDSLKPTIVLKTPDNNAIIIGGVIINCTVTDLHLFQVNYSLNGGSDISLPDPYDIQTSGWLDGDYTIQINAVDLAGNSDSTWYHFTIDSSLPKIVLVAPVNNSIIIGGTILDFSITDSNLMSVNYSINGGSNVSFSYPYDISTSGWVDGDYTILIETLDLAGNSNSSWFLFTIDSTPPSISIDPALNHSTIPVGKTIPLSIPDPDIDTVSYSTDGVDYFVILSPYEIDTTHIPDGLYSIRIKANDTVGNEAMIWFRVTIDAILPFVDHTFPSNRSDDVAIDSTIVITFNEPMNTSNVNIYLSFSPSADFTYYWGTNNKDLYISFESSNLDRGVTYTLIIDSQISDANGNPMEGDFILTFTTEALDTDDDGIPDSEDNDDDNDGHLDDEDAFPLNAMEWLDTDSDGIGNNADPDDDDDGTLDENDWDPLDPNVWKKAEEPSDMTWLIVLVIIVVCIVILLLFMRRRGFESEEGPEPTEEDVDLEVKEEEEQEPSEDEVDFGAMDEEEQELSEDEVDFEVMEGEDQEPSEDETDFEVMEEEQEPSEDEVDFEVMEEEQEPSKDEIDFEVIEEGEQEPLEDEEVTSEELEEAEDDEEEADEEAETD
jgi:parallel beta-helix repeat protein